MEGDFVVESKGHCFICLEEISSHNQLFRDGNGKADHGSDLGVSPTCSLEILSRFLGMEMRKVLHQGAEDLIPLHLFETFNMSKLKAELCVQCGLHNANFVKLYKKLEKIQMEILACLNQIYLSLLKGEKGKFVGLRNLTEPTVKSVAGWNSSKLDILKILRGDAIEKCSLLIRSNPPRVKVQNMSKVEIEKLKCIANGKSSSDCKNLEFAVSSKSEIDAGTVMTVKMEYSADNSIPMDEDNHDYPDSDSDTSSDSASCASHPDLKININQKNDTDPATSKQIKQEIENEASSSRIPNVKVPKIKLDPKTKKYKCGICHNEYTQERNYQSHYRAHHLNAKIRCTLCGKEFNYRHHYRSHFLKAHKGCKFPETLKLRKPEANNKYKFDPETGKYQCCLCGKEFRQAGSVHRHYKAAHLNHKFKCTVCEQEFKHGTDYRTHRLTAHMGVTFSCQVCGVNIRRSNLKQHQATCGKPSKHVCCCHICGKGFTTASHLKTHLDEIHLNPQKRVFCCHICGRSFTAARTLKMHLEEIHLNPQKRVCDRCGRIFKGRRTLRDHQRGRYCGNKN